MLVDIAFHLFAERVVGQPRMPVMRAVNENVEIGKRAEFGHPTRPEHGPRPQHRIVTGHAEVFGQFAAALKNAGNEVRNPPDAEEGRPSFIVEQQRDDRSPDDCNADILIADRAADLGICQRRIFVKVQPAIDCGAGEHAGDQIKPDETSPERQRRLRIGIRPQFPVRRFIQVGMVPNMAFAIDGVGGEHGRPQEPPQPNADFTGLAKCLVCCLVKTTGPAK